MMKVTVKDIEKEIGELERWLQTPLPMSVWAKVISRYHALDIKLCQMRGISPVVTHGKTDYII